MTKWFVKAGRYQAGDDMFIQLQSDMVETPRLDDGQVITLLERIGLFYQAKGCGMKPYRDLNKHLPHVT